MTWLSWLTTLVLNWLAEKLTSFIAWLARLLVRKNKEESANKKVGENLENANTKEERDESAKNVIDNF